MGRDKTKKTVRDTQCWGRTDLGDGEATMLSQGGHCRAGPKAHAGVSALLWDSRKASPAGRCKEGKTESEGSAPHGLHGSTEQFSILVILALK